MRRRAFEALVARALEELPARFRRHLENVAVVVKREPSPEEVEALGMSPDEELLGAYFGESLPERGAVPSGLLPVQILIYQGPIERACTSPEEMVEEIRRTVMHEIGHFFGLEDEEMPY